MSYAVIYVVNVRQVSHVCVFANKEVTLAKYDLMLGTKDWHGNYDEWLNVQTREENLIMLYGKAEFKLWICVNRCCHQSLEGPTIFTIASLSPD